MKLFLAILVSVIFYGTVSAQKKRTIDIDQVASLVLKRSVEEKTFVGDVFSSTFLNKCDYACKNNGN